MLPREVLLAAATPCTIGVFDNLAATRVLVVRTHAYVHGIAVHLEPVLFLDAVGLGPGEAFALRGRGRGSGGGRVLSTVTPGYAVFGGGGRATAIALVMVSPGNPTLTRNGAVVGASATRIRGPRTGIFISSLRGHDDTVWVRQQRVSGLISGTFQSCEGALQTEVLTTSSSLSRKSCSKSSEHCPL